MPPARRIVRNSALGTGPFVAMLERTLKSDIGSAVRHYASIARPDHWIKNLFMLPGTALALALYPDLAAGRTLGGDILSTLIALISTCLVASANYTLNEWLDAEFDKFHPVKSERPAADGKLDGRMVYVQYALLAAAGLALAATVGRMVLLFSVLLLVMGLIYNVEPIRSKDKAYIDVLTESINNPLRLLLGWCAIVDSALPPVSVLVSYWMGGAYLMAIKRYAELRLIDDPDLAARYRRSFAGYDEKKLLVSAVFYAINSAFFLGIFLIKYRFEFLLSFPFFALLFSWYLGISIDARARAISPERLHQERKFAVYVCVLVVMLTGLLFIDIPFLSYFVDHNQIIRHK
jgi:decaprenyl-phosphate phosphoribosyltransferase